jgi:membrane-associated phospholipid phosphatase
VVLWIWAPLVALARVAMGVHYLSDVIVGAILGVIVGILGLGFYEALHAWFVGWSGFSFW